jgi:hypothetical protein
MSRREIVLSMSIAAALVLCGCDRPAPDEPNSELNASLLRYLQLAGVGCNVVLSSQMLNEESTAWRVACAENRTYLASVESDGAQICVSPMPYGYALVPLPPQANPPQSLEETSRCVPYSVG